MLRNINHCFRNVKKLIGIDFGKTLFQVSGSFLGVCSPLIEPQPDFYRGGFQRIRLLKAPMEGFPLVNFIFVKIYSCNILR